MSQSLILVGHLIGISHVLGTGRMFQVNPSRLIPGF